MSATLLTLVSIFKRTNLSFKFPIPFVLHHSRVAPTWSGDERLDIGLEEGQQDKAEGERGGAAWHARAADDERWYVDFADDDDAGGPAGFRISSAMRKHHRLRQLVPRVFAHQG